MTFWGWARYCSKHVHVEGCNKCIEICASSLSLAKVILRCTVSEILKKIFIEIRHTYSEIKQYWHAVLIMCFFYEFVRDFFSSCSALIHINRCETKQWSSLWWIFWHTIVISGCNVEWKCINTSDEKFGLIADRRALKKMSVF